jgi:beta-glucosidase
MVAVKQIALLAGLAHWADAAEKVITNDTHFYGQSPPVYPSRMLYRFLFNEMGRP